MSTDKNLRLDMEIVHIKGHPVRRKNEKSRSGILFINKQEMVEGNRGSFLQLH